MKLSTLLAIAALCLGAFAGCARRQSVTDPGAPPAQVQKDTILFPTNAPQLAYLTVESVRERRDLASGFSGRLAWDDDVTARIFPSVSGRIVEILASPGQHVTNGAALARIKSPDFGQAQADARKAAADLNVAERALKRVHELLEHGVASQRDAEAAEADYARATSERERTLATLALYGADAAVSQGGVDGLFALKSPVGGVVVEKLVGPGQEVRSDQVGDRPLFVVSDPTRLWLFLDVTEADAALLRSNQLVTVHARALPDKTFEGRVEVIGEGLDPATRTIKARCVVDNSQKLLRAEMYVSADVSSAAAGVEIPTTAVFSKDDAHYVFVESVPGQFQRRAVTLGIECNGRSVITGGLSANERIVTDGCLLLEQVLEGQSS
jgi:cobalt-zinc-cadmium efflux system membrane fusion protein